MTACKDAWQTWADVSAVTTSTVNPQKFRPPKEFGQLISYAKQLLGYSGPPLIYLSLPYHKIPLFNYCKTHYYHTPLNFTHFALGNDNAYITGADIRSN